MEQELNHDSEHGHDSEIAETTMVDDHGHGETLLDGIIEITFGLEHIVAEFFWNAVFVAATFLLTRGIALRKAHKYIDSKHGVDHEEGY